MNPIYALDAADWDATFPPEQQALAMRALEQGQVLFFPHLACPIRPHEQKFLSPDVLHGANPSVISFRSPCAPARTARR